MNSNEALANEVEALIKAAGQAIEKQELPLANDLLKRGLDRLGDSYAEPDGIDDSGQKLVAATVLEREGNLQSAVLIRYRILSERLIILRRRLKMAR